MSERSRRNFIRTTLLGALGGATATGLGAQEPRAKAERRAAGGVRGETIGMVIYPGFTALDLFGPHHFFFAALPGAEILLVAKDRTPVETDSKVALLPTTTFADCPEKLTILFVPGGTAGTLKAARDEETRRFVADRGAKAEWVTSVCTGSLILAAAGLLTGRKATCHWLVRERLKLFGAIPVDERVVIDGNRVTGAGVTSGLDFGLSLVKQLRGDDFARQTQLFSEYDPAPPFDAGSPRKNPPAVVEKMAERYRAFDDKVCRLAEALRADPLPPVAPPK